MSKGIVEEKCSECGYWKAEEEGIGLCRRNAPHPQITERPGEVFLVAFPRTGPKDWCGEFMSKEGKKAGTWGR